MGKLLPSEAARCSFDYAAFSRLISMPNQSGQTETLLGRNVFSKSRITISRRYTAKADKLCDQSLSVSQLAPVV
jgi:hypothetical protein